MATIPATVLSPLAPLATPAPVEAVELASWDQWSPQDYLRDYYTLVEPDEIETIRFIAEAARRLTDPSPVLVFGCGPTLHHVFPVAPYASEIHLADYLPGNLEEIMAWINRRGPFHDWRPFVRYCLRCEGMAAPTDADIAAREDMVRDKITRCSQADAGDDDSLGPLCRAAYRVVVSCYCADSATGDKAVWNRYMTNITSMVGRRGFFVTAALRTAAYYRVGERFFPSAAVDERDLRTILDRELGEDVVVETRVVPEHEALGYTGVLLGHAVKRC